MRGSDAAAAIILQTGGIPVMAMGGFSGSDPAPTVAQLEQYVKEGKLHYVLTGGTGGFGGGGGHGLVRHLMGRAELHQGARVGLRRFYQLGQRQRGRQGVAATVAQTLYHCG